MIFRPSPNFDVRALPVSMVVLHYTGMPDAGSALDRLTNPVAKVSAHYVVAEDGVVVALVDEAKRAWHAGKSWWRGVTDVNSTSVGIEIVNPGHEFGYRPFPEPQMAAVVALVGGIVARYRVAPGNVVGHSDIAPVRKDDPGELFDWPRLARAGLADRIPTTVDAALPPTGPVRRDRPSRFICGLASAPSASLLACAGAPPNDSGLALVNCKKICPALEDAL